MAYTKVIKYGEITEFYQYDRSPSTNRKKHLPLSPEARTLWDFGHIPEEDTKRKQKEIRTPSNIRRAKVELFRLIAANLADNDPPVFASLTYAENMLDVRKGRTDFANFARIARKEFGASFKHITVLEFQERGAVHFHSIIWGITKEQVASERSTRMVAKMWSQGFLDLVQTDGKIAIAGYLTNYLTECLSDPRMIGQKAFICSRNVLRPVVDKEVKLLNYPELSTGELLRTVEYETQWLGRCHYQQFKRKEL